VIDIEVVARVCWKGIGVGSRRWRCSMEKRLWKGSRRRKQWAIDQSLLVEDGCGAKRMKNLEVRWASFKHLVVQPERRWNNIP
jgi:hypothetical protein